MFEFGMPMICLIKCPTKIFCTNISCKLEKLVYLLVFWLLNVKEDIKPKFNHLWFPTFHLTHQTMDFDSMRMLVICSFSNGRTQCRCVRRLELSLMFSHGDCLHKERSCHPSTKSITQMGTTQHILGEGGCSAPPKCI